MNAGEMPRPSESLSLLLERLRRDTEDLGHRGQSRRGNALPLADGRRCDGAGICDPFHGALSAQCIG